MSSAWPLEPANLREEIHALIKMFTMGLPESVVFSDQAKFQAVY